MVIPGHAHNDYEHERPLLDAIQNGFMSVEVDVHLINDELYVAHDQPGEPDPSKTLETLYLKPLESFFEKNDGKIYRGYDGDFFLMIDFKSEAVPTYHKLTEVLSRYRHLLRVVNDGKIEPGAVRVFISGNRPMGQIINAASSLAGIDGRPQDLEMNISSAVMPVVSDEFVNHLSWDGVNEIDDEELRRFKALIEEVHKQKKLIRFWAIPDQPGIWQFLLDHHVDLINTDQPEGFHSFYEKSYQHR